MGGAGASRGGIEDLDRGNDMWRPGGLDDHHAPPPSAGPFPELANNFPGQRFQGHSGQGQQQPLGVNNASVRKCYEVSVNNIIWHTLLCYLFTNKCFPFTIRINHSCGFCTDL